jgi:hypothetical protein
MNNQSSFEAFFSNQFNAMLLLLVEKFKKQSLSKDPHIMDELKNHQVNSPLNF